MGMNVYEESLGYAVKRTQQAVRQAMDKVLSSIGLTTPQYAALSALASEPGLSNAELARRCFVTPQTMHQLTGGLEARGLIERSQLPEHGRIIQIGVAEAGAKLLEEAHGLVYTVEKKMVEGISAAEREGVGEVLRRCYTALEKARGSKPQPERDSSKIIEQNPVSSLRELGRTV